MAPTTQVVMLDDDGVETVVALPSNWEICSCCDGNGKSSAYLGAFTASDMEEEGREFMEDYMNGEYDRPCDNCSGSGKVLVIDESRCTTDEHKRALVWVRDQQAMMDEERAIVRSEMRHAGDWS